MDWVRRRGFTSVSIWICPPKKRSNYIFCFRPDHQAIPDQSRLCDWYWAIARWEHVALVGSEKGVLVETVAGVGGWRVYNGIMLYNFDGTLAVICCESRLPPEVS